MSERKKTFLQKLAGLPGDLGRGLADRTGLACKLATQGPVTPYMEGWRNEVPEVAYVVDAGGLDVAWALAMGYYGGFTNFADIRTKGVVPPIERQPVGPPGFQWNEESGQYEQIVWRGCLKPDREKR